MGPAMLLSCETEIAYRREQLMRDAARSRRFARPTRTVGGDGRPGLLRRLVLRRTPAVARHV